MNKDEALNAGMDKYIKNSLFFNAIFGAIFVIGMFGFAIYIYLEHLS